MQQWMTGSYFKFLVAFFIGLTPLYTQAAYQTSKTIGDYEEEKKVDQLLLLIQKRLVIMHEVARTKWNQNLPIEDKAREQQILQKLVKQADQYDIEASWVTQFFEAQIEAAKGVQRADFSQWREQGMGLFDSTLSLREDLRFYIDRINQEMIELLSKMEPETRFILPYPLSVRLSDAIEDEVWLIAISPFKNR